MSYSYQNQNNHYLRKQPSHHRAYHSQHRYINNNTNNNNGGGGNIIYMGDLDNEWDESIISSIWNGLGFSRYHIKMMTGYCFIEFNNVNDSQRAISYNGSHIPNHPHHIFRLNWSNRGGSGGGGGEYSLFVGDLSSNVSENELYELFHNRYKSTVKVKIMIDLNSGMSKGYGFVNFSDPLEQNNALIEMQGVILNGRAIKLGPGSRSQGGSSTVTSSGSSSNNNTVKIPTRHSNNGILPFIGNIQTWPIMNHFTDPNNSTVFIGGLSSQVNEYELRSLFEPFGEIVYINIPMGKGCGFIQYVKRESGEMAINSMQGFPIGNSRIRLSWGRSAKQSGGSAGVTSINSNTNYIAQSSIPMNYSNEGSYSHYDNISLLPGFHTQTQPHTQPSIAFDRLETRSHDMYY